uniref:Tetratricopeptide repeat protein n=1 Tax=Oscillatoriales cyanobacterium SpSt-418 TaxID=2282169 RepID=A0A7C3PQX1_9CYAN
MREMFLRSIMSVMVFTGLILLIEVLWVPARTHQIQSSDPNEDAHFAISPKAFWLPYSSADLNPGEPFYIFFRGEPIYLELWLRNNTRRPIPISGSAGRWPDLISWKIYKDGIEIGAKMVKLLDLSAEVKLDSTGRPIVGKFVDMSTLNPGEAVRKEITLTQRDGTNLTLGTYKISLLFEPRSLGSQFPLPNRQIPAGTDFGIKEIKTRNDKLNYYFHLVQIYRRKKEHKKAQTVINEMLKLNPNSIAAFLELGWLYYEQGKAEQAVEAINKAIKITEMNLDPENIVSHQTHMREDSISFLKQLIERFRKNPQ